MAAGNRERERRWGQRQNITFKGIPPVIYFLLLGLIFY
jgi:hypothetical protein